MSLVTAAGGDTGGLFAAIDARDGAAFVAYLTENAVFRFGSAPPVQGRDAIRAAVDGFFTTIAGCSHVMEYDGILIAHYKIYMDVAPLFA